MNKVPQGKKLTPANDAGQMPPTEANPVRQRYQMGCHQGSGGGGSGGGGTSRVKTRSRQFNRGSGGGGSSSGY